MKKSLKIGWIAVLIAAAVSARYSAAAEPKQEAKPKAAQETPQLSLSAAAPVTPPPALFAPPAGRVTPVKIELKIEKLDLIAAVKEISKEDPKAAAELYRAVSDIYTRKQKPDKAISLLETYRRKEGADQALLSNLANLYMQYGAAGEAVVIWENQVKLHPEDTGSTMLLVNFYRQKGDLKKAVALLESGAKDNPKNPEVFMQLGNYYNEQRDWAKAEEAVKKAIELRPQFWYYQQLAQLSLQQDKLDAALAVLEEGIKKLPGSEGELTLAMSDMCLQKGQNDKAEKILNGLMEKVKEPWRKDEIKRRLSSITQKVETPAMSVPAVSTTVTGGKQ